MIVCEIKKKSDLSFNLREVRESERGCENRRKKIELRACVGWNKIERDFFYDKKIFERKTCLFDCHKKSLPLPPAPITAASKLRKKTNFFVIKRKKKKKKKLFKSELFTNSRLILIVS